MDWRPFTTLSLSLATRHVPLHRVRQRIVEETDPVEVPERCTPRQGMECFYDTALPSKARKHKYTTQASFRRHYKRGHASYYNQEDLQPCSGCGTFLEHENHYKVHALAEHGSGY